jgi:hypothetical protein
MAWQWPAPQSLADVRYSPRTGRRLSLVGRVWWFWRTGGRSRTVWN